MSERQRTCDRQHDRDCDRKIQRCDRKRQRQKKNNDRKREMTTVRDGAAETDKETETAIETNRERHTGR